MWSDWLVFRDCGFHSVCPLMEKDKRLMEASCWKRLTEEETVFFWLAGPCSVNLESNFLLMGAGVGSCLAARCWGGGCAALERLWGNTPRPGAKEKPQQGRRWGKIAFRIKPQSRQRRSEGSNKSVHQDPETPQRLSPEEVWVSSGLPQGQGLWVQQTWVWPKPSWRRSPLTPP